MVLPPFVPLSWRLAAGGLPWHRPALPPLGWVCMVLFSHQHTGFL